MKRIGILVLMYVVRGLSGVVYHSMTTGSADRARIAALDGALQETGPRNGNGCQELRNARCAAFFDPETR